MLTTIFGQEKLSDFTPEEQKAIKAELLERKQADEKLLKDIPAGLANRKGVFIVPADSAGPGYVLFWIVNNSASVVSFWGYSVDSPNCRIQIAEKGKWKDKEQPGLCGNGLGVSELPAGKCACFRVYSTPAGNDYRVGVELWGKDGKANIVWSKE